MFTAILGRSDLMTEFGIKKGSDGSGYLYFSFQQAKTFVRLSIQREIAWLQAEDRRIAAIKKTDLLE